MTATLTPAKQHLAVIEVDGKQRWIFETNRLRDAVGASFLVAQVGESARSVGAGELIVSASGLARAIFPTHDAAKAWISKITGDFAVRAPGMEVYGACAEIASDSVQDLDAATRAAYAALTEARGALGGPALLDRTLPWTLPCSYSGLPAVDAKNPVPEEHADGRRVGAGVLARREVFGDSRDRVKQQLRAHSGLDEALIRRINDAVVAAHDAVGAGAEPLSDRESWRGVVHVDANGLGQIFLNFGRIAAALGARTVADYSEKIQAFSQAINRAAWRAVGLAIDEVLSAPRQRKLPVYPLVVGGDDITLVTDGRWALALARAVLRHWEAQTRAPEISGVLSAAHALGLAPHATHLPACGGVAIVKHHFPFSIASDLAGDLCDKAKESFRGPGISGLDWHAVMDASPPDLDEIRARARVDGTVLTRRPYPLPAFDELILAAQLLSRRDEEGRFELPRAQLNSLREGLFVRQAEAASRRRMSRIDERGGHDGLRAVLQALHGADTLYLDERTPDGAVRRCGLLDAYDHLELMEGLEIP